MASSLNKVQIIGFCGRDVEMSYLSSGKPVSKFSVAVSRSWNNASGEKQEDTEWLTVEAWDKLAEITNQYLHKGSKVYIEGRLKTDSYTDKDGVQRKAVKLVAQEMIMLDGKSNGDNSGSSSNSPIDDVDISSVPF